LRPCGSYLRLKIAPSNIGQRQVFSPSGQDCCNHSFYLINTDILRIILYQWLTFAPTISLFCKSVKFESW
jgi:hypothetical protein